MDILAGQNRSMFSQGKFLTLSKQSASKADPFSGLGTGIAFSAGFISLQASIDPKDKAAAAAGLFMTTTLGTIIGMAGTSAIIQGYLRYSVQLDLTRLGMSQAEISEVS